jgi:hypothetical protein
MMDRIEAVAKALAHQRVAFRHLEAGFAVVAALQRNADQFAAHLQKAGAAGLDLQLEDRLEAEALIETLSRITTVGAADRKAIMNAASVRLTLTPPQRLNERSVAYDEAGRISRITDTPFFAGKLMIETFAHHTVLREDDADYA